MIADPITELGLLLAAAGARATFDRHRNLTHPCYRCGTTERPRDLVTVGRYLRPFGGGLLPGDRLVRPLCKSCDDDTKGDQMIDVSKMTDEQLATIATDGRAAREELERRAAQRDIEAARELADKIKIGVVYFTRTITGDVLKVRTLEVGHHGRIKCEMLEVSKGSRTRALIWNRPFDIHPSQLHFTLEEAAKR